MTSQGTNTMKWGILLTVLHVYLFNKFELLPAFVGYFLVMKGMYDISAETKLDYMEKLKGESTRLFVFSVIYWITGIFIGYSYALQKLILIVFFLFDVLFFGNYLNKMVKYLKENLRTSEADKLRKQRMLFIKMYFGLIIFYAITLLPNLLVFAHIGSDGFIELLSMILQYIFISLMLLLKLFLSFLVQQFHV